MSIVFYISSHGLGHASRDVALLNTIGGRRPDLRLVARTNAAPWFFELAARVPVKIAALETDVGVVQIDSLRLDEDETARRAAAFYSDFERRVDDEARYLGETGAAIVLGDIPPLAFAAAARAGVPSIAIGNFTWDWIYEAYPSFADIAPEVLPTIRDAYGHATAALRLPMHGGFEPMAAVTRDVPFIARRSERDPQDLRRALGIDSSRPVVLASFGGYGARLAYTEVLRERRLTVLATDRELDGCDGPAADPHLMRFDLRDVYARGFRYEDFVAAADVVVSKPGYGIVSECIANDTALLYTSRGRFPEHEVFVAEMPQVLRCRHIPQEDLLAGRWADAIDALLTQPPPPDRPRLDGAEVAADEILNRVIG